MRFTSLTDPNDTVSFEQALMRGIAKDGSLYFPDTIPRLNSDEIRQLEGADRQEIAARLFNKWLSDEIPESDLLKIIRDASTFDTPVVSVGDKKVLELFHGPTMAFKDIAARYLAAFMSYFNEKHGRHSTVLVATSGDTGGAIAHGFGDVKGLNVVVLYPEGRVSKLQLEQLRRVKSNVWALEVSGSFDDCQSLVKQALADSDLTAKLNLTSANSINIGRLLPQSTYYAYAYSQSGPEMGRVVVPSGNLGNLTGGAIARSMGVPIPGFLAANNLNDTFVRYAQTGKYQPADTIPTFSNAMDVGAPNNLPRLVKLFERSNEPLKKAIQVTQISDEDTVETIKQVYGSTGYLLDPHTAVAWRASDIVPSPFNSPDIIVATASPLKFAEEILAKTGIKVDNNAELEALKVNSVRYSKIKSSIDGLKNFLKDNAQ